MQVQEIASRLGMESYGSAQSKERDVESLYAGDLLSWVMGHSDVNQAWATVQTHSNIIAVAQLKELACIIIVEGADIPQETMDKAMEENIALLSTTLTMAEVCVQFAQLEV